MTVRKFDNGSVYRRYLAYLEIGVSGDDAWTLAEGDEMGAWLKAFIDCQPKANGGQDIPMAESYPAGAIS